VSASQMRNSCHIESVEALSSPWSQSCRLANRSSRASQDTAFHCKGVATEGARPWDERSEGREGRLRKGATLLNWMPRQGRLVGLEMPLNGVGSGARVPLVGLKLGLMGPKPGWLKLLGRGGRGGSKNMLSEGM
jgi:hypothetical protein